MPNKLKTKNKQFERMGIAKTEAGDYKYINEREKSLKDNIVANPKEMQRGIEEIMDDK